MTKIIKRTKTKHVIRIIIFVEIMYEMGKSVSHSHFPHKPIFNLDNELNRVDENIRKGTGGKHY